MKGLPVGGEVERDIPEVPRMEAQRGRTTHSDKASLPNWAWASLAIVSFHAAYLAPDWAFLILGYAMGLAGLALHGKPKTGFRIGIVLGLAVFAPHLTFFWRIFGPLAIALWLVLAFWIGLFLCLSRLAVERWGRSRVAFLVPFLWIGLEYARSELYYLRFSWLNMGYAFAAHPRTLWLTMGVYGAGLIAMTLACRVLMLQGKRRLIAALSALFLAALELGNSNHRSAGRNIGSQLPIAGAQLEFPGATEVVMALKRVEHDAPEAKLVVLSEYTFDGPIPDNVKQWCRKSGRYLIAGGKDRLPSGGYYNTAFVIDPNGEVIFRQAKSVPIQFFDDGLPAAKQELWNSPWGKIGICICYDLSYTRITDELVRQGAQALIVPTSDVMDWGVYQHQLHAHVAPVRAAEYGIPILRLASSGISQLVDSDGFVAKSGSIPGEGEIIQGTIKLGSPGKVPTDRWLGFGSAIGSAITLAAMSKRLYKIKIAV